MIPSDWLLIRIATANKVVKSLDEAMSARALGAGLLNMTRQFGVLSIIAGSIPRELPCGPSELCGPAEWWRRLPPSDVEVEPAASHPSVFTGNRTHLFGRNPEAEEIAHFIVNGTRSGDEWARAGKGLLFAVVGNEADNFGLGFFGPAISTGPEIERSLAFYAYYGFARLLKIDRMSAAPRLSDRQILTLKWAAEGKTDQEIAAILNVSGHTVDKYMRQIKQTLNAVNRTSAIVLAMRQGLIG